MLLHTYVARLPLHLWVPLAIRDVLHVNWLKLFCSLQLERKFEA